MKNLLNNIKTLQELGMDDCQISIGLRLQAVKIDKLVYSLRVHAVSYDANTNTLTGQVLQPTAYKGDYRLLPAKLNNETMVWEIVE